MSRRERWARRVVGVVIGCDLVVGLTGIVLGPGLYLFIRPFVYAGSGILAAFALAIGLGSAGMLWAGLAAWRALRAEPARLPRTLALGSSLALVAAFPGLAWGIWLGRFIATGRDFWGNEGLAAGATLVLALPLLAALGGFVAWLRCRRAADWETRRASPQWPRRTVWLLAAGVLTVACGWPGGQPGSQTDQIFEGRTPHEWIGQLGVGVDAANVASVALLRAGPVAIPDVVAAIEARQGLRWEASRWFAELASKGSFVAPLLEGVVLDDHLDTIAVFLARRHGRAASALAAPLVRWLGRLPTYWEAVALQALEATGGDAAPEACATARAALRSPDPRRRVLAARACARLGPTAATPAELVDLLTILLHAKDNEVVTAAAIALGDLGVDGARAAPNLLEHLRPGRRVATDAVRDSLVKIGRASPDTLHRWLAEFGAGRVDRLTSLIGFCRAGVATPEVLAALEDAVGSTKRFERDLAIHWSGVLGPAAAPLLPAIEPHLATADPRAAAEAALACLAIGGPTETRLAPLRATLVKSTWMGVPIDLVDRLREHPELIPHFEPELRGLLTGTEYRSAHQAAGLLLLADLDTAGAARMRLERSLTSAGPRDSTSALAAVFACRDCGPKARMLLPALYAYRDSLGAFWPYTYDAIDAVEGRTPPR